MDTDNNNNAPASENVGEQATDTTTADANTSGSDNNTGDTAASSAETQPEVPSESAAS